MKTSVRASEIEIFCSIDQACRARSTGSISMFSCPRSRSAKLKKLGSSESPPKIRKTPRCRNSQKESITKRPYMSKKLTEARLMQTFGTLIMGPALYRFERKWLHGHVILLPAFVLLKSKQLLSMCWCLCKLILSKITV
jgi:hypothetical protein